MAIVLRHVCVLTKDMNKAIDFYVDNLEFKVLRRKALSGEYPETILGIPKVLLLYTKLRDKGGNILEIIEYMNPRFTPKVTYAHMAFTVSSIKKTYLKLVKKGVKFLSPPTKAADSDVKVCFCMDCDNNLIELVED